MSGDLITDKIMPDGELTIEGDLKVTGKIIIESPDDLAANDNSVAVKSQVRAYVQEIAFDIMPIGTIVPFSGRKDQVPDAWLACDGTEYLIDENNKYYPLYQIVGKQWGGSDTTFKLPDLEGRFLRGVDNGKGNDPDAADRRELDTAGEISEVVAGDVVGSYQNDTFQGHYFYSGVPMPYEHPNHTIYGITYDEAPGLAVYRTTGSAANIPFGQAITSLPKDDGHGEPRLSNETRPQNAAVNFIIKY